MKELQAANESRQQELESVRKVGTDAGLGESSSFQCRGHSCFPYKLWVYQDQVNVVFREIFLVVNCVLSKSV